MTTWRTWPLRPWDTCLILTPPAAGWLADAMIVVPATVSTINKWAAGISDTLALGLINEAIGMSIPIVAVPHVNAPLARHPALAASFATLRGAGVTVLDALG